MPSIRRFQRPGPKSLDALNATTAQKGPHQKNLDALVLAWDAPCDGSCGGTEHGDCSHDRHPRPAPPFAGIAPGGTREHCVNRPSARVSNEEALHAIAGVLDKSVGSLDIEGARTYTDDGVRMCPPFSLVEMGDPYTPTLARDHARGAWVVAPWADLAEEYEKEHELGDYAPGAQDDEENY